MMLTHSQQHLLQFEGRIRLIMYSNPYCLVCYFYVYNSYLQARYVTVKHRCYSYLSPLSWALSVVTFKWEHSSITPIITASCSQAGSRVFNEKGGGSVVTYDMPFLLPPSHLNQSSSAIALLRAELLLSSRAIALKLTC